MLESSFRSTTRQVCFYYRRNRIFGLYNKHSQIQLGTEKTLVIKKFTMPKSLPELTRFLGMFNYSRRFIPNYSRIASPLIGLTKSEAEFIYISSREKEVWKSSETYLFRGLY